MCGNLQIKRTLRRTMMRRAAEDAYIDCDEFGRRLTPPLVIFRWIHLAEAKLEAQESTLSPACWRTRPRALATTRTEPASVRPRPVCRDGRSTATNASENDSGSVRMTRGRSPQASAREDTAVAQRGIGDSGGDSDVNAVSDPCSGTLGFTGKSSS